jgi:hypothetical protein
MKAESVFLTRVHRGILQAACFPESRKTQMDPFFLFLPLVIQEMPTSTPRLLTTKPVGTSTHRNIKILQEVVEPDISASARRSGVSY